LGDTYSYIHNVLIFDNRTAGSMETSGKDVDGEKEDNKCLEEHGREQKNAHGENKSK